MELRAENITKTYEGKQILKDVSLTLEEGECISLLGASGIGKTTLFHILSGLELPDSGSVFLDGKDITGKQGKIAYMLQKDLLMQHKTILDNVAMPLILNGEKKKLARQKAESFFKRFGLDGTQAQYPSMLSGGMRQRAALLRTHLCGLPITLLDEPFSALDAVTRNDMQEWFLEMMKDIRLSVIFITHDIDEAMLLSDRIYMMEGKPASVTEREKDIRNERSEVSCLCKN